MDGNSSQKSECNVFDNGHFITFDSLQSGPEKSVYACACGFSVVEFEDASL